MNELSLYLKKKGHERPSAANGDSRAKIRSCSSSRDRYTNVKGHTGTRDQLCLCGGKAVWVLVWVSVSADVVVDDVCTI